MLCVTPKVPEGSWFRRAVAPADAAVADLIYPAPDWMVRGGVLQQDAGPAAARVTALLSEGGTVRDIKLITRYREGCCRWLLKTVKIDRACRGRSTRCGGS